MTEKILKTRIIQKHDTEANWLKANDFIPFQGEMIIYDVDENNAKERMKIGDGVTNVNDLPFAHSYVTDEEVIEYLIELDLLVTVTDTDGAVLTDENDNILIW